MPPLNPANSTLLSRRPKAATRASQRFDTMPAISRKRKPATPVQPEPIKIDDSEPDVITVVQPKKLGRGLLSTKKKPVKAAKPAVKSEPRPAINPSVKPVVKPNPVPRATSHSTVRNVGPATCAMPPRESGNSILLPGRKRDTKQKTPVTKGSKKQEICEVDWDSEYDEEPEEYENPVELRVPHPAKKAKAKTPIPKAKTQTLQHHKSISSKRHSVIPEPEYSDYDYDGEGSDEVLRTHDGETFYDFDDFEEEEEPVKPKKSKKPEPLTFKSGPAKGLAVNPQFLSTQQRQSFGIPEPPAVSVETYFGIGMDEPDFEMATGETSSEDEEAAPVKEQVQATSKAKLGRGLLGKKRSRDDDGEVTGRGLLGKPRVQAVKVPHEVDFREKKRIKTEPAEDGIALFSHVQLPVLSNKQKRQYTFIPDLEESITVKIKSEEPVDDDMEDDFQSAKEEQSPTPPPVKSLQDTTPNNPTPFSLAATRQNPAKAAKKAKTTSSSGKVVKVKPSKPQRGRPKGSKASNTKASSSSDKPKVTKAATSRASRKARSPTISSTADSEDDAPSFRQTVLTTCFPNSKNPISRPQSKPATTPVVSTLAPAKFSRPAFKPDSPLRPSDQHDELSDDELLFTPPDEPLLTSKTTILASSLHHAEDLLRRNLDFDSTSTQNLPLLSRPRYRRDTASLCSSEDEDDELVHAYQTAPLNDPNRPWRRLSSPSVGPDEAPSQESKADLRRAYLEGPHHETGQVYNDDADAVEDAIDAMFDDDVMRKGRQELVAREYPEPEMLGVGNRESQEEEFSNYYLEEVPSTSVAPLGLLDDVESSASTIRSTTTSQRKNNLARSGLPEFVKKVKLSSPAPNEHFDWGEAKVLELGSSSGEPDSEDDEDENRPVPNLIKAQRIGAKREKIPNQYGNSEVDFDFENRDRDRQVGPYGTDEAQWDCEDRSDCEDSHVASVLEKRPHQVSGVLSDFDKEDIERENAELQEKMALEKHQEDEKKKGGVVREVLATPAVPRVRTESEVEAIQELRYPVKRDVEEQQEHSQSEVDAGEELTRARNNTVAVDQDLEVDGDIVPVLMPESATEPRSTSPPAVAVPILQEIAKADSRRPVDIFADHDDFYKHLFGTQNYNKFYADKTAEPAPRASPFTSPRNRNKLVPVSPVLAKLPTPAEEEEEEEEEHFENDFERWRHKSRGLNMHESIAPVSEKLKKQARDLLSELPESNEQLEANQANRSTEHIHDDYCIHHPELCDLEEVNNEPPRRRQMLEPRRIIYSSQFPTSPRRSAPIAKMLPSPSTSPSTSHREPSLISAGQTESESSEGDEPPCPSDHIHDEFCRDFNSPSYCLGVEINNELPPELSSDDIKSEEHPPTRIIHWRDSTMESELEQLELKRQQKEIAKDVIRRYAGHVEVQMRAGVRVERGVLGRMVREGTGC
ncbi:hypothetical protein BJ508DRAFT_334435 [Ascobolus immersus RN42]|uniref:Uncharacterized protein n=1 Tax=Ascobolus immersus RN42 TaxID=1160509 RepID=A0A3N4HJJ8_ASCIM|nr:hypothetical protein BJ508DRAFT_334435 [Ascobolus immersus RN42]